LCKSRSELNILAFSNVSWTILNIHVLGVV
jgi:hypothetical protein